MVKFIIYLFSLEILFACHLQAMNYSTNFMWINKQIDKNNTYIFPETRIKEEWDIKIADWIIEWLKGNPQGQFNFWYDKNTVTDDQIDQTRGLFERLSEKFLKDGKLLLKDVNELNYVKENQFFSAETPIYIKTDLLRVALTVEEVENCNERCASIYADVDKGLIKVNDHFKDVGLSEDELFDETTMQGLEDMGIVLQENNENNFFILSNFKPNMIRALKTVVLDSSLLRVNKLIEEQSQLRKDLPDSFKNAPLDRNFAKIDGFQEIDEQLRNKLKQNAQANIEAVFWNMVHGPLLLCFNFLEKRINAAFKNGDSTDLESQLKSPQFYSGLIINRSLLPFQNLSKNNLKFSLNEDNLPTNLKDVTSMTIFDYFPTKNMHGSPSSSFCLDWDIPVNVGQRSRKNIRNFARHSSCSLL